MELAVKYSVKPWSSRRSGLFLSTGPKSRFNVCNSAKPANASGSKPVAYCRSCFNKAGSRFCPRSSDAATGGPGGRGGGAGDDLELGKRGIADETLVGEDFGVGGMVHGEQPDLVEVVPLLHGLAEAEANAAVAKFYAPAVDLDVFVGVGNVG